MRMQTKNEVQKENKTISLAINGISYANKKIVCVCAMRRHGNKSKMLPGCLDWIGSRRPNPVNNKNDKMK